MPVSVAKKKSILAGKAKATPVTELGLSGRREVYLDKSSCSVLIDRASRFVRKDAQAFLALLEASERHVGRPLSGLVLIRRAPVCSKARAMLEESGVEVAEVS